MNSNIKNADVFKNIKLLALSNFLIDFRLFSPIAIIYFSNQVNSYAFGMSIFSAIMITQTLFEMPMGVVSDFVGRRRTMILGFISIIISLLFYVSELGYTYLLIGDLFEGLSMTFLAEITLPYFMNR